MNTEYDEEEEMDDDETLLGDDEVDEALNFDGDDSVDDGDLEQTEDYDDSTKTSDKSIPEVLQLTEYNDQMLASNNTYGVVAEYNDIDLETVNKKHEIMAKNFVTKITKFILEFNDVELSETHKKYIKEVAQLQMGHLVDLLSLVDINKQMLNNIIRRVNATQAEDYAIITSYINLGNQHLKLIKELQSTYKSLPSVIKKMKADVLCNQEIDGESNANIITENYNTTQFNTSKQLLRKILYEEQEKNKTPGEQPLKN